MLGVTGLGVDMTYIQDMIADLEEEYKVKASFVKYFLNFVLCLSVYILS